MDGSTGGFRLGSVYRPGGLEEAMYRPAEEEGAVLTQTSLHQTRFSARFAGASPGASSNRASGDTGGRAADDAKKLHKTQTLALLGPALGPLPPVPDNRPGREEPQGEFFGARKWLFAEHMNPPTQGKPRQFDF
jgi:hypothetical protein